MQENEEYCAGDQKYSETRADLGDVTNVDFMDWWCTTQDLFLTAYTVGMWDYSYRDVNDAGLAQEPMGDEWKWVKFDLSQSRAELRDLFETWLYDNGVSNKAGRRPIEISERGAKYPFASRPDCMVLEITFGLYLIKKQNPTKALSWIGNQYPWALGSKASENILVGNNDPSSIDKNIQMTRIVSRYLNKIERLVDNAALGKFPCWD